MMRAAFAQPAASLRHNSLFGFDTTENEKKRRGGSLAELLSSGNGQLPPSNCGICFLIDTVRFVQAVCSNETDLHDPYSILVISLSNSIFTIVLVSSVILCCHSLRITLRVRVSRQPSQLNVAIFVIIFGK